MKIERGARIIIDDWLEAQREEVIYLITDEKHQLEAKAFERAIEARGAIPKVTFLSSENIQEGDVLNEISNVMNYADAVIGAATYSIITTEVVNTAMRAGTRFLSLPMHTNNGKSFLSFDFLTMSPRKAKQIGQPLLNALKKAERIHAVTAAGTDISFEKKGRTPGLFNGIANRRGSLSSSSFEVYVPIEETCTNGRVVLDGSMGYLGLVSDKLELEFKNGYLTRIGAGKDGERLRKYIDSFKDKEMKCAAEFGIGLNSISRCLGNCYIEDESTFSTFHIGLGRNLALGGQHDASGHFDIVIHEPDIWADSNKIMERGVPL